MTWIEWIPGINAALNIISASLIGLGYYFIRNKRILQHQRCMIAATITSALFLAFYIIGWLMQGVTRFPGQGAIRTFYLAFLGIHELLAIASLPLVIFTLLYAWKKDFSRHRRIARITFPIWLYVMVSGFIIYLMLHHLYA